MNFLRNIFSPSVDSITASLQRTVAKLEAHAANKTDSAETLHKASDALFSAAVEAENEASRARRTASKVQDLLA